MASGVLINYVFVVFLFLTTAATALAASLKYDYYAEVCPLALPTIRRVVEAAVVKDRRMGGSILRLHFHDCFVNGCDASVLLDESTPNSERNAGPNLGSARGFEVIDQIKEEVDRVCSESVVSCADILAVAARDSVAALGGPWWHVQLGRKDSTKAYVDIANVDIPRPTMDLPQLIESFGKQGLNVKDLFTLSGGHTLGFAQCFSFRDRIYNGSNNIDPKFASLIKQICPQTGGDTNLAGLDSTPTRFDTSYFANLVNRKGILHSDCWKYDGNSFALFGGVPTDGIVRNYNSNPKLFWADFARSMAKMGSIKPLAGEQGEIRSTCSKLN